MRVTITGIDIGKQLKEAAAFLNSYKVRIGIPDGGGSHGALSDVELAFILTNGSAVNNNPPRPFLEPALSQDAAQSKIARDMKESARAACEGNLGGAMAQLNAAGMDGASAVKEYMDSGAFAANSPITVSGGWMRSKKKTLVAKDGHAYGKAFKVKGKGSSKPLIDTGALQSAITYVIEGK